MQPEIGSKWQARDGRIMRVDKIDTPVNRAVEPQVYLTILNPSKRGRQFTVMGSSNFNPCAFMKPVSHEAPTDAR